ncbi:MAG: deoxyribose-phosphate aldolase [Bacteroidales bacterium]|nr:deoxyribose-phosphate aldolase [Bacteroidales bacterium]
MSKITEALNQYTRLSEAEIEAKVADILSDKMAANRHQKVFETILGCIDLTSLNTTDTEESIADLTTKVNDFGNNYPELPNVAAICVYPALVKTVRDTLTEGVEIAAVTGGFPHSQTFIEVKIAETSLAILDGASEIDIVLPVGKLLDGKNEELVEDIQELKAACNDAHLKVILESGILKMEDLQRAAILSMESGADFIKTSTGKLEKGATTTAAYGMCQMILEYYRISGRKVGFKAAGGISTTEEALQYYCIVESVLGEEWLNKDLLRFGASRLANNLVSDILGKQISCF